MPGFAEEFAEVTKRNETLAPFTFLKVGGPAEFLVQPRTRDELAAIVHRCFRDGIPMRVLGTGCNLLVRDEGVVGAVLRLVAPAFTTISVEGTRVRAGTGAAVAALISESARHGLAGLETLVGIPGTVGGALRTNAGDRVGHIGQFVRSVEVLDAHGAAHVRERDELQFADNATNLDDPVLLTAEFALDQDSADHIVKRMRKAWILRKASLPLTYQPGGRVFKDPRGINAAALIEQAGLARTRVGGAEVSERDANFIVIHPGATARDVMRLIDLVRSRVHDRFHVDLEREITIW